jgi:long-subunit fatty acid transport protein
MRRLYLILLTLLPLSNAFSQEHEFMVWTEAGVRGDLVKRTDWMVELNSRFDGQGVATFFPQVGVEYKIKKWIKPSVEYRFIIDRNKYGNYKSSHRLNLNANFKENFDRLGVGLRVRYQYAFQQFGAPQDYNADFDQAIRLKPSLSYDINNSIFTPTLSTEFFYNPELGENGRQFTKMRLAVGSKLELDGPHSVSFKYQLDKRFNDYESGMRHVMSFSYGFKF